LLFYKIYGCIRAYQNFEFLIKINNRECSFSHGLWFKTIDYNEFSVFELVSF